MVPRLPHARGRSRRHVDVDVGRRADAPPVAPGQGHSGHAGRFRGLAQELKKPLRKNDRGWFDVLGHPDRGLQMPEEPGFRGRVAILIDGGSFSASYTAPIAPSPKGRTMR